MRVRPRSNRIGTGRAPLIALGLAVLLLALAASSAQAVFGSLTFVEFEKDGVGGVDGLDGAEDVAISPDGAHVYASSSNDDAVVAFSRDATTGELTFVEFEKDGVGGVDGIDDSRGVTVSPDGANVYVTGLVDDAVAVFTRNQDTGALTFVEFEKDSVGGVDGLDAAAGVDVSPDGAHVYVTGRGDDAVAAFVRAPGSGALTFVEFEKDGVGGVDGLNGADDLVAVGSHVYVVGTIDDAVAAFSRNTTTGSLSFVEFEKDGVGGVDGLDAPEGVAASPDGANVYTTAFVDDAVTTFSRDASTGALGFVEFEKQDVDGVTGLDTAVGIAVSPDGAHVYVGATGEDTLATFSRAPGTGALSFLEVDRSEEDAMNQMDSPGGVTASSDGGHVYVTGIASNTVVGFAREGAPPAPAPTARSVSFDAKKAKKGKGVARLSVKKGRKARFTGDVSAPTDVAACESAQTVELQRRKPKQENFITFDQVQTDGTGEFSVTRKIKKTFVYRAVVVANSVCDDAASGSEKVKAKKKKKKK